MYGNRHLIPFAQQPGGDHAQYLCQQNDDQTLISNKYVLGTVNVTTNPSWNENFRFEFYEESGELICIITSQNYRCDDASRRVVIHRSLTAVHIYYRYSPTEDLRIEIISYKAYNKIKELVIPVSSTSVSHAKAACIRDLRVSNNKAFATSMIVFLLRDGLYRKTMNNVLYGNQASQIVQAITQASASAHREAMTLITNSTTNLA
ncbi:unnamed protein product [Rotaria sordida]|nr:unnamed protein product [Rotaria sordida]